MALQDCQLSHIKVLNGSTEIVCCWSFTAHFSQKKTPGLNYKRSRSKAKLKLRSIRRSIACPVQWEGVIGFVLCISQLWNMNKTVLLLLTLLLHMKLPQMYTLLIVTKENQTAPFSVLMNNSVTVTTQFPMKAQTPTAGSRNAVSSSVWSCQINRHNQPLCSCHACVWHKHGTWRAPCREGAMLFRGA